MRNQFVYLFTPEHTDGDASMKLLLGGKGANLAEMSRIGFPVPPGFTIGTNACASVVDTGKWPGNLEAEVRAGIAALEKAMGSSFGDPVNPLLLSVRSGAAVSMPGMMDTVLNLGINDAVAEGLAKLTGNPRFAYDNYRRFIDMFGDVVVGVPHSLFDEALDRLKAERGCTEDADLTADDFRELVDRYKALYRRETGRMIPGDPFEQLRLAIDAVFRSWMGDRAVRYRQINQIIGLVGTAVNVQAMVYGNRGEASATGVCFSRNPANGENTLYGEYLQNAQGEDIVAGIRTPLPISEMKETFPELHHELLENVRRLEHHFGDMQDIEFTIEDGKLYILQTRSGKRTGAAALQVAVDMVNEGLAKENHAVGKLVSPEHIDQLLHPQFKNGRDYRQRVLGKGLPASPGAAAGQVVFTAPVAEQWKAEGKQVILARVETSPEDIGGMDAAQGILTSRGGITSHAAVVARGWGKPCVAGCGDIIVNEVHKTLTNGEVTVREGDWISINGSTGEVILGKEELADPDPSPAFDTFMSWVSRYIRMGVRANADTPEDARTAIAFGAEGIGLCRTEHMFFGDDRIWSMRKMILAQTDAERKQALEELLVLQRGDFEEMFQVMNGRPITIRLLDPPLHEFLPHTAADKEATAERLGLPLPEIEARVIRMHEQNPMLGHRGCRLGITNPQVTRMQARAILEAALSVQSEGTSVRPEIMIPLIGTKAELADQRVLVDQVAEELFAWSGSRVKYLVGTMIEVPRAALTADSIATEADFFSFGTNDLTQMTFGYSRDDSASFLPHYVSESILPADPFMTLDTEGVGRLMQVAVESGRTTRPDLKLGLCGEHGGDPVSVAWCAQLGLNYVSCSPFRVPVARLAAAKAALNN